MKIARLLLKGQLLLLALVSAAGAQNTAPVPITVAIREPMEDVIEEQVGNMLPASDPITYQIARADTVSPFVLTIDVTAVDSPSVTLRYTTNYNGTIHPARTITRFSHQEVILPLGANTSGDDMPDSLLSIRLNSSQTVGNRVRFERRLLPRGSPYWVEFEFSQDSVMGTASDTSLTYKLEGGVAEALFGLYTAYATPEITYFMEYNVGLGWGALNPLDTLATATWTSNLTAAGWRYKHLIDRPSAYWYRMIRVGEATPDTGVVRQGLFIVPKRN